MSQTTQRIFFRLFFTAALFLAASTSSQAFAQRWSLQNVRCATIADCFYVVEKPLTINITMKGKTSRVTFKTGQQVMFKKEAGKYTVAVQTKVGDTWFQNRVGITPSELDDHFSEPVEVDGKSLRPSMVNGLPLIGTGVKLATTPSAAGDRGPGGMTYLKPGSFPATTETTLDQSRLVDAGTGKASNWFLAQHVCFDNSADEEDERCGWVRGDQIAQTGKRAVTASMAPAPASAAREYPCTHGTGLSGDTIYKLKEVTALLTREASNAEVQARNALMDHVGSCAFWPPQLPPEKIEALIRPFDKKDMNLYDAVVREKVIQEWDRITPPKSNQLAAIRVRSGGKSRPMTRLDFIKIDVLARTIYGENRFCANQPGHLEATARTMINRARINKPA
ncbi:MAG: hypothetical protein EOP05_16480, partial [Proteobacteria bacterium]